MNIKSRISQFTGLVFAAAGAIIFTANAYAAVSVNFTKPEGFADMPFSDSGKEDVYKELRRHFDKLGAKLPAGQDLKIDVRDINLAGSIEPQRISTNGDFRILRGGADFPMMEFKYVIEADGKVVKSGDARISDFNYLRGLNRYSANEPLRYEKKMLDEWFVKEIAPTKN